MPFAVLSFSATDTLKVSRFYFSCPQELKDYLEDTLSVEASENGSEGDVTGGEVTGGEDYYVTWNGNSCVLSKGYYIDVHELLNRVEEHGWGISQFSTSLTGSGVQCQTYVFEQPRQNPTENS